MATIDIKLKSYDELTFEITRLNTDKYLLEQKVDKYKEVIDKAIEYIEERAKKAGVKLMPREEELLDILRGTND